jgi:hypothetical protein
MSLVANALYLRKGRSWISSRLGWSMVFSLVMHLTLEQYYTVDDSEQFSFLSCYFFATFEPKDIGHALSDHNWVNSMHEELENFERNQV